MNFLKLDLNKLLKISRTALVTLIFSIISISTKADCDPINDPGCDIDLPIDNHVWLLIIVTIIISAFYLKSKPSVK